MDKNDFYKNIGHLLGIVVVASFTVCLVASIFAATLKFVMWLF